MGTTAKWFVTRLLRSAAVIVAGCTPNAPVTGGQSTDYGSSRACTIESSEITLEQARELGFMVDADMMFFGPTFEASFYRGLGCAKDERSVDGQVKVRVDLERVLLLEQHPNPAVANITEDQCPDSLAYQGTTHLDAGDGLLTGHFTSIWHSNSGFIATEYLAGRATDDYGIDTLSGSLGIRIDVTRPHTTVFAADLELGDNGPAGFMRFSVSYDDDGEPEDDQGEGLRFPAPDPHCEEIEPAPTGSPLVSLDDYAARD